PGSEIIKLPDNLPNKNATLIEPYTCAVGCIDRYKSIHDWVAGDAFEISDTIVIYGVGAIGMLMVAGFYLAAAALENIKDQGALKENEIKAAKILTKYAKAQEIYKKHYGDYAANASGLIIEENGKYIVIDSKLKVLNASYSKENPANGYYYVELVERGSKSHNSSFFLSAVPAQYGISGLNTFWIDKRGVVMKKNNGAKPIYYNINFLDESRGD
ncbi:MAG: DUF2950 family protein, partial [Candidatus Omnitrophica bacterium]|nr:DUF2950 family protein [Candidatus Omnitrophota bacterium]